MVFGIQIGTDGKAICPCCRDYLWHCKKCWNKYHNGEKHKDYIQPEYYGQPFSESLKKIQEKMKEEYGIKIEKIMKPNKNRKYKEGEYH